MGNRLKYLNDAIALINKVIGAVETRSSVYETEPWGKTEQPLFLNMVIKVRTELVPYVLLEKVLEIERMLGRIRIEKWSERKIDIDVLFYNDMVINIKGLVVPHPYLQERRFVLIPLSEIAPDLMHPVLHNSISELLLKCNDLTEVKQKNIEPAV
jgi:2-amino-4-hydroxy-6-hydroxymethyldihydropteridine diphosphokinase